MPTNPPVSSRPWLAGQAQHRRPKGSSRAAPTVQATPPKENTLSVDTPASDRELVLTRLMGLFFDIPLGLLAVTEGPNYVCCARKCCTISQPVARQTPSCEQMYSSFPGGVDALRATWFVSVVSPGRGCRPHRSCQKPMPQHPSRVGGLTVSRPLRGIAGGARQSSQAAVARERPGNGGGPGADTSHCGGCRPGDDSHSSMCEAVSNWRALRKRLSRSLPIGTVRAFCLSRSAS